MIGMKNEYEILRKRLMSHLEDDLMRFWCRPEVIGNPIGNFPTYIDQFGSPVDGCVHYSRMQGRRTYAYFIAYDLTGKSEYLKLGEAGLKWIETLRHPALGYYSVADKNGKPIDAPISVQDLSYVAMAYPIAYTLTGRIEYLCRCWDLIEVVMRSRFVEDCRFVLDVLDSATGNPIDDGKSLSPNIVSVLDFLNALYLPTLSASPNEIITDVRIEMLRRLTDSLVDDYYGDSIFWNDTRNRFDMDAKHVDMGHTAKAYGVLYKAEAFLSAHGAATSRYRKMMEVFPAMLQAATDAQYGWKTDFNGSCYSFHIKDLQWWRHIIINQVAALYAKKCKSLEPLIVNGVRTWLDLDYIDRTRHCAGVRQRLNAVGMCESDSDCDVSKANEWKSAYHEVEHVMSMCKFLKEADSR